VDELLKSTMLHEGFGSLLVATTEAVLKLVHAHYGENGDTGTIDLDFI